MVATGGRGLPWWRIMGGLAALVALAGAAVSLTRPGLIYGAETAALADAAIAQDVVGVGVAAALLVLARRSDPPSTLVWLGGLLFFVYNYAIYAFSVHFGPLFLVWVAVLGLSLSGLIGGLADAATSARPHPDAGGRATGAFLIAVAVVFAALWLAEIVPDLLAGRPSTSAAGWLVPTNPVHVLDLAFFLPWTLAAGLLVLRRHRLGVTLAVPALTWLVLTCLPIFATPAVAAAQGHTAEWAVYAPIGLVFALSVWFLATDLRRLGRTLPGVASATQSA